MSFVHDMTRVIAVFFTTHHIVLLHVSARQLAHSTDDGKKAARTLVDLTYAWQVWALLQHTYLLGDRQRETCWLKNLAFVLSGVRCARREESSSFCWWWWKCISKNLFHSSATMLGFAFINRTDEKSAETINRIEECCRIEKQTHNLKWQRCRESLQ